MSLPILAFSMRLSLSFVGTFDGAWEVKLFNMTYLCPDDSGCNQDISTQESVANARNHTTHNSSGHVNSTSVRYVRCICTNTSTPALPAEDQMEMQAFMYIIVVVLFYATSIVFLLIKYARNDDEEKHLKYQYSEFVKRERFQAPQYKNKLALERTKIYLETIKCNEVPIFSNSKYPIITITPCSDGSGSPVCDGETRESTTDTNSETATCINVSEMANGIPKTLCGQCDKGSQWRKQSSNGGTSLSYDSGLDYLARVGLDDIRIYTDCWADVI